MSVDNPELETPEQILDDFLIWHWKQFSTGKYKKLANIPYSGSTQDKSIAALEAYYKAQASKDMAEVINSGKGYDDHAVLLFKLLKTEQRKTAAAKGYKVEGESRA